MQVESTMVEIPVTQQPINRAPEKEALARTDIVTTVRPGVMVAMATGESLSFTYFPHGMGNDQSGCQLFTGIEIKTSATVNTDEFQLLVKTTIESFPEIKDDATLHRIEKTVESVYNGIHGDQSVKVDSIRVVQHDSSTDELRYHVLNVDCPSCHQKTKVVLTWDAVQARSNNPSPIVRMFFKKEKTECGHSFIAFLDRSLKVKGCESVDM
jgi:hypothetical protein